MRNSKGYYDNKRVITSFGSHEPQTSMELESSEKGRNQKGRKNSKKGKTMRIPEESPAIHVILATAEEHNEEEMVWSDKSP